MGDMSSHLAELVDALPEGVVVTDPERIEKYRWDRSQDPDTGTPAAVVRVQDAGQVQTAVRWAAAHRVPVVPRGAGSGLSGGSSAVDGGIVLSLERMAAVEIDPTCQVAVVEPGAFNKDVKAAAAEHGLWYPPDPSSYEFCSIGGNVATNAGGLCCVKYGVTTDYVLGLEVVLADGRAVRLGGRTVKDVAGYDLKRLFVGSEGTLGVITEATLRLRPLPAPVTTIVATFDDVVAAGRAVTAVMAALRPAALELMDAAAVAAVEAVRPMGLDACIGALLVAQVETAREAALVEAAFGGADATYVAASDDAEEGEMLMAARRMAIPCVERLGTVLIEDVAVPIPRIPELVASVAETAARYDTAIPVIGHAGDGNLHPLVCFDAADPDATARAEAAFDEIMGTALGLGGTVTGEHGVGSLKARHLRAQLGPDVLDLMRSVKAALDPAGILNPGKWL